MADVIRKVSSNKRRTVHNNAERHYLIWLDPTVNTQDNLNAQEKLRTVINDLEIFEDIQQCVDYIRDISSHDRIVLITTGEYATQFIPEIHELQQIYYIYIYCVNKEFYQQWSESYSKVKGIHNQIDPLIAQIQGDHMRRVGQTVDEPLLMSIYNSKVNPEQSTSGLDGRFVHSQLLIDCLLRMEPTPTDKGEFISLCKEEYDENKSVLKDIDEFERTYSKENAIEWYTKDSFVYRLLNKSLRIQDIDLLFGLRFLIRDIEEELQRKQCQIPIRVYRGQLMSSDELDILKQSKEKLISINSFFSTSLDKNVALTFLDQQNKNPDFEKVLFEIDADPRLVGIKPFANIAESSVFHEEAEILMMLGSVFRIDNVQLGQHFIWIVHLTLCSDTDHDLKSIFEHMKNQYGAEQTRLLEFGHVLVDMARFDDAEKYYLRLLKELTEESLSGHSDRAYCYHALGKVACEKADYKLSLEWLYKSLEITENQLKKNSRIGFIYTSIGEVYQRQNDTKQALKAYKKALEIWTKVFHKNHEYVAWCYNNIGIIYDAQKQYLKALHYHNKALSIKKNLPPQHPCLSNTYLNMGNVYYHLSQYDQAFYFYQLSYDIYAQSLTPEHPSIAGVTRNIGIIYEVQGKYSDALRNYRRASSIREQSFLSTHPDSIELEKDIQRVLLKIN